MKTSIFSCIIALAAFAALAQEPAPAAKPAPASAKAPAPRPWTSNGGDKIEAAFVSLDGMTVTLRTAPDSAAGGKTIRVPLSIFIPADQQEIRRLDALAKTPAKAEEAGAKPNLLPVFLEGPNRNLNTVYRHPKFVAKIDARGVLSLAFLENGESVKRPPVTIQPNCGYQSPAGDWKGRTIVRFDKFPQPLETPAADKPFKVELEGEREDGVKFGTYYEFHKNTIRVWGWIEDPAAISRPTNFGIAVSFRDPCGFANDVPVDERKKILKPFSVELKPVKGNAKVFPYGEVARDFNGPCKTLAIRGPLFGEKNKLAIESPGTGACHLNAWLYNDFAPYQGYSISLVKSDKTARAREQSMLLRVD